MHTNTLPRTGRPGTTRGRETEGIVVQERISLQETIKFGIECLFGSVRGTWIYEQLGLAGCLEQRLGTAETVELIAMYEEIVAWHRVVGGVNGNCNPGKPVDDDARDHSPQNANEIPEKTRNSATDERAVSMFDDGILL